MKIKKNNKIVKLTESDLKKIVKKTLNEQSKIIPSSSEGKPPLCDDSVIADVRRNISETNNLKFKVETAINYPWADPKDVFSKYLVITHSNGNVCGCLKSDFFKS